jgi:carboxypeptidase C (cathepsin A)
VGLGETDDDMQVFYYFIKSENDPKKDPLMLWLTGGPGCSSFSGLVSEIGNFQIITLFFTFSESCFDTLLVLLVTKYCFTRYEAET